jgi:hypothetical protein
MKQFLGVICGLGFGLSCLGGPKAEHVEFIITVHGVNGWVRQGFATLDGSAFNFAFEAVYNADGAAIYGAGSRLVTSNLAYGIWPPSSGWAGGFELSPSQAAQVKAGLWYVCEKAANGNIVATGQIYPVR